MFRILVLIGLIFLLSCEQEATKSKPSLRDAALSIYLNEADSLPGYDTMNRDFQMLRAYYNNDTTYLHEYLLGHKQYIAYIKKEEYKQDHIYPDSCVHQQRLDHSNFEEAYRFKYTQSFCPFKTNVTVLKKGDLMVLNFILYKPPYDPQWDTSGCRIIKQYSKELTSKDWIQIHDALTHADFWALSRINDVHGLDGSTLEVEGFLNERLKTPHPPKYHFVRRWIGSPSALSDAFAIVLKLSGNKEGCFIVK